MLLSENVAFLLIGAILLCSSLGVQAVEEANREAKVGLDAQKQGSDQDTKEKLKDRVPLREVVDGVNEADPTNPQKIQGRTLRLDIKGRPRDSDVEATGVRPAGAAEAVGTPEPQDAIKDPPSQMEPETRIDTKATESDTAAIGGSPAAGGDAAAVGQDMAMGQPHQDPVNGAKVADSTGSDSTAYRTADPPPADESATNTTSQSATNADSAIPSDSSGSKPTSAGESVTTHGTTGTEPTAATSNTANSTVPSSGTEPSADTGSTSTDADSTSGNVTSVDSMKSKSETESPDNEQKRPDTAPDDEPKVTTGETTTGPDSGGSSDSSTNKHVNPDTRSDKEQEVPTPTPPPAGVDLSEHDMPTFADFKKEFYEKDTKKNGRQNKVYEAQPVVKKEATPTVLTGELRNYASTECGAKVIGSNQEADSQQFALNENNDEYMIQLCTARKWLVIELCEPVLIRRIDIGNLEPFSSTFENFTVFISKTNAAVGKEKPGKDWHLIGAFHAKEQRGIQGFNIDQLNIYTLFVKIEFTSHYGNEHYCPITVVRVHGATVDDDDDDDVNPPSEPSAKQADVKQEVDVPCTDDIASPSAKSHGDIKEDTKLGGVIFPPQPMECLQCYDTQDQVPLCGLPEFYEVKPQNTTHTSNDIARVHISGSAGPQHTPAVVDIAESEMKPCEPDSAPSRPSSPPSDPPTDAVEPQEQAAASISTQSTNHSSPPATDVTEKAEPAAKVQASPVAVDTGVGNSFVLVTATPSIPAEKVEQVEPTQDVVQADAVSPPDDSQLVLPSPPTLAEPPTIAPEVAPIPAEQPAGDTATAAVEEEPAAAVKKEIVEKDKVDPPPPAPRHGKKNAALSKLVNQVKSLEDSLQMTNRYLEEMSKKYKNQKENLQIALNHTMRSLQGTTLRLDILTKEYASLKESNEQLSEQFVKLQERVDDLESPGWITHIVSLGTVLFAILIINCRQNRAKGIDREEIERILEDLPDSPIRRGRHKRSGSASEVVVHDVVPADAGLLKRARSYAAFDSAPISDVGAVSDALVGGTNEYEVGGAREGSHKPDPLRKVLRAEVAAFPPSTALGPQSAAPVPQDGIEIVSPATWRSFDTPDGKSTKVKKKKRSGKAKARSIFSEEGGPRETIQEGSILNSQSPAFTTGQRSSTDQSVDSNRHSASNGSTTKTYSSQNGANQNSITRSHSSKLPGGADKSQDSNPESSWIVELFRRRSAT